MSSTRPDIHIADDLLAATKRTAAEHVAWAEVAARDCAVDESPELRAALARVHERLADTDFRLALVGEFSSGKSTFINALLDEPPLFPERWLKTSSLATTGAATEVRHGDLALEARLAGRAEPLAFTGRGCALVEAIAEHLDGEEPPADMTGMLRVLTTDARLAGVVEAVRLTHPDPLLGEHVVLVDTPGINANEDYSHHAEVTRRAVQRADTALVFIPADRPLSLSLQRFLDEELQPYLPRCVFLVSRLARIDAGERDALVAWVRGQIAERFGIEDPPVLGAALNVAEAYARDPGSVDDADMHWVARFAALERTLHERLGRQRAHLVSESALRVVEQLVAALHAHLSEQHDQLADAQRELEASAVRPVEDVARELRAASMARIDGAVKRAEEQGMRAIERERRALAAAIRAKLARSDKAMLKQRAATALEPLAAKHAVKVTDALVACTAALTRSAETVAGDIALRFSEEYHALGPRARTARSSAHEVEPFETITPLIRALDTYALKWLVHKPDTRVPYDLEDYSYLAVSTVRHWFKTTDEVREELLRAILQPVDGAFAALQQQYAERLAKWRARERRRAGDDIKRRTKAYGDVVAALRAEHAHERLRLRALVAQTQTAIEEAERRLAALRDERGRLGEISTC